MQEMNNSMKPSKQETQGELPDSFNLLVNPRPQNKDIMDIRTKNTDKISPIWLYLQVACNKKCLAIIIPLRKTFLISKIYLLG